MWKFLQKSEWLIGAALMLLFVAANCLGVGSPNDGIPP